MKTVISSKLKSTDAVYRPSRYSGPANPVGNPQANTRIRAPLAENAPPAVLHPKLNKSPWSTSYAVHRTETTKNKRQRRVRNAS